VQPYESTAGCKGENWETLGKLVSQQTAATVKRTEDEQNLLCAGCFEMYQAQAGLRLLKASENLH